MRKWHSWKDDYMKADEIYLVHAYRSEYDYKYFIGTFTGRYKDILYFKDNFDHEIQLHIADYIYEDKFKIEFVPLDEIRDWLSGKSNDEDEKEDNIIAGTIESIVRDRGKDRFVCDVKVVENKSVYLNADAMGVDTLFDYFRDGTKVKLELYHDNGDIPGIANIDDDCEDYDD